MTNEGKTVERLKAFDTASITNVVASYPGDAAGCLGLYNPWRVNWYTDERIHCVFPELGPRVGYAVTVRYGMPDSNYHRLDFGDVLRAIDRSPKPVIVVMEQALPEAIRHKNGLSGGNMTTAMKRVGCVGVVTDGPSRDMQEIREMDFQYLLTGICAGHGDFQIDAVNVPVSVCGMDVAPGELIHMDENGACKFPADKARQVLELVEKLCDKEKTHMQTMRESATTADLVAIFTNEKKQTM
ncbi:MAG: RraA family protein [Clostridia bacterium]